MATATKKETAAERPAPREGAFVPEMHDDDEGRLRDLMDGAEFSEAFMQNYFAAQRAYHQYQSGALPFDHLVKLVEKERNIKIYVKSNGSAHRVIDENEPGGGDQISRRE